MCGCVQHLEVGTLILGAVREIGEYDVTISLPFNMVGSVGISDISNPLLKVVQETLGEGNEEVSTLRRKFLVGFDQQSLFLGV